MTIFDIETGPLPDAQLDLVKPKFTAPANYKDPEKIAAYIADSEVSWKQRASLSALTGRVLAIGIADDEHEIIEGDEAEMLKSFWERFDNPGDWAGFCVRSFDIPFLAQRSFVHGVKVPSTLWSARRMSLRVVDLQELWLCYGRNSEGASLDAVCRACGLGGKTGSGVDFARLYETDREAALKYLHDDLLLTEQLADRLL